MTELFALVGQSWRGLLLYPGGLSLLAALATSAWLLADDPRGLLRLAPPDLPAIAIAVLALALLPLPQTGWLYPLDLLALLLAVELPFWWRRLRGLHCPERAAAIFAPLLNVYPLLALAVATLGTAAGSLVLREINRSGGALHWLGLVAWAMALPPLLHLGPWRAGHTPDLLGALRRLAHLALLLAAALPSHEHISRLTTPIAFVALIAPLAAFHRFVGRGPEGIRE